MNDKNAILVVGMMHQRMQNLRKRYLCFLTVRFFVDDKLFLLDPKFLLEYRKLLLLLPIVEGSYRFFSCSIPGAAMRMTYGRNSVLLCSIFRDEGLQSSTHILP